MGEEESKKHQRSHRQLTSGSPIGSNPGRYEFLAGCASSTDKSVNGYVGSLEEEDR